MKNSSKIKIPYDQGRPCLGICTNELTSNFTHIYITILIGAVFIIVCKWKQHKFLLQMNRYWKNIYIHIHLCIHTNICVYVYYGMIIAAKKKIFQVTVWT